MIADFGLAIDDLVILRHQTLNAELSSRWTGSEVYCRAGMVNDLPARESGGKAQGRSRPTGTSLVRWDVLSFLKFISVHVKYIP